jgi:hypothetical protein
VLAGRAAARGGAGGNLLATETLLVLAAVAALLVAAIIVWPLIVAGRPELPAPIFRAGLAYFACIGFGFMFIQIPFLQRFSVYLGHPTYTFSIILFLMILAAGLGSLLSDRIDVDRHRRIVRIPIAIGAAVLIELALIQPVTTATAPWPLAGRTIVVALFVVPLATALGFCFPLGMRLIGRHSDRVAAWMWGVNGACGVMASILAVMTSMWIGIPANLMIAAALYLILPIAMRRLLRRQPE